jgi:imidazolonepropionase-like amidohydrolase
VKSCVALLLAAWIPGAAQAEVVALRGATVHTVSGPTIDNGTVVMDGGRITAVGASVAVPAGARVIDLSGLHLYPSFIDANSVLGLTEIGSVRGTVDISETGDVNPNARAEVALNADSDLLPVARAGGILVAMACPRGGLVAGSAAVFRLEGWNWEDMVIRSPVGVLINWPNMRINRDPEAQPSAEEQTKSRDEKLRMLDNTFADARSYLKARDAEGQDGVPVHDRDPRWDSMVRVLKGEIPVLVSANDILQIRAALRWSQEQGVRMVLLSDGDVSQVADELKRRKVPVVLGPTWDLPMRRWQPYDAPFTIASTLHAAGVQFCFAGGGSGFTASNARNLPIEAANAVAYGLPRDVALRAMTLGAAEVMGVADRFGSIDVGKEATLIATDGDPLDIRFHVVRAFIAGRETSLETRQTRLWEKYRNRPLPAGGPPATVPAATASRR